MADEWTRTHSNGWTGWVVPHLVQPSLYVGAAGPTGKNRSGGTYATVALAKLASDEAVHQESGHKCSFACEPWREEQI